MINLVVLFVAPLERAGIRYAITGSVAGSAYGEPRLTNDVDIDGAWRAVRAQLTSTKT